MATFLSQKCLRGPACLASARGEICATYLPNQSAQERGSSTVLYPPLPGPIRVLYHICDAFSVRSFKVHGHEDVIEPISDISLFVPKS